MTHDGYIFIYTLNNGFEADLLMDALDKEGIVAMVQTFADTAYDGLFIPQRGWGRILVPEEDAGRAREVIQPLIQDLETTQIYEDPGEIHPLLWNDLEQADPDAVSENALVIYEPESNSFRVPFMDGELIVNVPDRTITPAEPMPHLKIGFQLYMVVLHYLLEAAATPLTGKWVNEKELPGGFMFFQRKGPHATPPEVFTEYFGSRGEIFKRASLALGGALEDAGDAAARFRVLPRIPLMFLLWEKDEEFDAAGHVRFDETVTRHLHGLDAVLAMVDVVAKRLVHAAKALEGVEPDLDEEE